MHYCFLPCLNSPSVLQQQSALLHSHVWRVRTYTKSLIRTDLHCAALKPQSCCRRKEKCLRVDCPIAHKQDKGRQQQSRIHSKLLDSFYSLFFSPPFFSQEDGTSRSASQWQTLLTFSILLVGMLVLK